MHPDSSFAMSRPAMEAVVRDVAVAHLFVAGPAGMAVVHAPVILSDAGDLHFHVARRNRAAALLGEGVRGIASIGGPGTYVSPDWYASEQQVPTWNYIAVEVEGAVEPLDEAGLIAQVDALGDLHEARLAPKPAWTRAKMDPARFDAMVRAIQGFVLRGDAWRGTPKLSQNKPAADVRGVIAALRGTGRDEAAALVERANAGRLA